MMKRIIHIIMRRLDLRLTRASSFELLLAHAAASERKTAELEGKLAVMFDSKDNGRPHEKPAQPIDHILAKIPTAGEALLPHTFAAICSDFSALSTVPAREQVSERLLSTILATDLARSDILSAPALKPLATHELFRQAAATRAFALGRLDESAAAWKQISVDLPSAFNLACHGRVLVAQDNRRDAFATLADAVELYPHNALLATEFAMFFVRVGDIDAANVALAAVKHGFLNERSALAPQQAELDRAIDEGRTGEAGDATSSTSPAQVGLTEFQGSLAAREAALRRVTARIIAESNGALTRTVEAGPATLTDGAAGGQVLLSQSSDAENSYPATLTQFYRRCSELGINHLVIGERIDFDRDSLCFHAPGAFPRVTRLGGGGRLLHDTRKLLGDAGYVVAETVNVPATLVPRLASPDPGYRLLHAVRRGQGRDQA